MCHRYKKEIVEDNYDDGDIPEVDNIDPNKIVEPLPESTRPRRDGPGGD